MQEGRAKKSLRNSVAGLTNSFLAIGFNFVKRTVFVHVLGAEYLGINGLFTNILAFLTLADLGLTTAMAYSYYKPLAQNDKNKIAALNRCYRKIYNIIALAIAVIGLGLTPFLKFIVNTKNPVPDVYFYGSYFLLLAQTVVTYLFVYKGTLITADQRQYLVTRVKTLTSLLCTVLEIIILLLTKNYLLYLSVALVTNIVNNLTISHFANKLFPYIRHSKEKLDKEEEKSIFSNIKSVFIYRLSGVLINSTDNLLISKIVGTVYVGYYSNYLIVINQLTSLINICFRSLTASLGNVLVTQTKEKQHEIFNTMQVASVWFGTVIASSVYLVINDFIFAWLGQDYMLDGLTVFAIMLNFYLLCILQPIWIFREASGLYMQIKYVMVITAVINIVLSIILGMWIGLAGILLASAIAKLLTYMWYEPILLFRKYFSANPWSFFKKLLLNFGGTCLLTGPLQFALSFIKFDNLWLLFFVRGFVAFAALNAVYLIVYHKNEYFLGILNRLKNIFLKRKKA